MPYEVTAPEFKLHDENKFFYGNLLRIELEEGQFGEQLKWIMHLDGEFSQDGVSPQETWMWCSNKITTSEKNKFRKYVKGLTGNEPQKGEVFDERHWTLDFYKENPEVSAEEKTGRKEPWRVAVMFEHKKKKDGTPFDAVQIFASEESIKNAS